jgi:diguanylate cyclase (GGDEF)-like protein/PAS domain S-box-containing protein
MIRKSLAVYIIGLIVLMVFLTAASHYYVEMLNRREILKIHEISKDSDIRYVIQSMMHVGNIQKVVDGLVRKLNIDVFQVTDHDGKVIYNVGDRTARGKPADYSKAIGSLMDEDILEVSESRLGWEIRAIVPAVFEKELVGTIMIGTLIDNDLAAVLARATDVQLTIGTKYSIVASSLAPMEMGHLDFNIIRRALDEGTLIRKNIPDTNRVVNYESINLAGKVFALVVEFDNSEFMLLQELRKKRYFFIFSSIILASIFLGAVLTVYLISPLKKLKAKAETTVLEITGREIATHSGNEVRALVQSFDIMVDSLTNHITERRLAEDALLESEKKYRSLVESTEDSIYLVDRDFKYVFINRKHLARLGLSEDNYIGQSYGAHHTNEETELFEEKIRLVFEAGKSYHYEHKSMRDGRHFLRTLSPVVNRDGYMEAVTVLSKDISYLKEMEEELRSLSLTDELTGLHNRRGFLTLAEQQLMIAGRFDKRMYLIFSDIDGMKEINDTYGHDEGDILLTDMAALLRESYRETDIIARVGGDEFIVLTTDNIDTSPQGLIDRFQDRLDEFNTRSSRSYKLSFSMGIAQYDPDNPVSVDQLIKQADKRMYHNKRFKDA